MSSTRLLRAVLQVAGTALLAVVIAVAGVTAWIVLQARRPPAGGGEYVALGSSFAAGPGVGGRAPGSPVLCIRSDGNYARLLAARRSLDLTDVSCSGATALHVLEGGPFFQRPQIEAVRPHTRLVTITVGGNDVAYIGNLAAWSCARTPAAVPRLWRRVACSIAPRDDIDVAFTRMEEQLRRIATEARARAPDARIIFVDYVTVLPDSGSCPDRMPLEEEQIARAREVAERLSAVTARVAREGGAGLVQASELSRQHHVCADEPWVFSYVFPHSPLAYGPLYYHPNEQAMAAVAAALDTLLTGGIVITDA